MDQERKYISRYELNLLSDIEKLKVLVEEATEKLLDLDIDNKNIENAYILVRDILNNEFTVDRPETYHPYLLVLGMYLIDFDELDTLSTIQIDNYDPVYPIDNSRYTLLKKHKDKLSQLKIEPISILKYVNMIVRYELSSINI